MHGERRRALDARVADAEVVDVGLDPSPVELVDGALRGLEIDVLTFDELDAGSKRLSPSRKRE